MGCDHGHGSGGWGSYSIDDLIAEGRRYAAVGCRYYKMKVHSPDPRVNRQRVEAVRKALGDAMQMMVDVNQKLDVPAAIHQAELMPRCEGGAFRISDRPGHGIALTSDAEKKYRLS
jgi:L-alanine-DL-glutamate epimerase-like enolase superfamily enzyme